MATPPDEPAAPAPMEVLDTRRRIYQIIVEAPGVHVREIERRAHVAYGAVEYHLHRLEQDGLVRGVEQGRLKAYFATQFPSSERDLHAALRVTAARRILVALLSYRELAHKDLAQAAGLGLSTVSLHAKRLVAKGLVAARVEGRRTFFTLTRPGAVEQAIVRHGHSLGDAALDAYVSLWTQWRRPTKPSPEEPPPKEP